MAENRIDPSEQIPEADLLEQQTSLDPQPLTDAVSELPEPPADADEADRLEQHATVPAGDEDDYPHEPIGAGCS
jgi:hypothetical protein